MDPEEQNQQPTDWRDLLIQLSRAYQASAPTEAQRGYVSPIERIFDPQVGALASGVTRPVQDTRITLDDALDKSSDFRFYLEAPQESLEYQIANAIYQGANKQYVDSLINENWKTDIERRSAAGDIDINALPQKKDYTDLSKTLFADYRTAKNAVKTSESEYEKAVLAADPFYQAGLPRPTEQFNPRELFPEQFKAIGQRLEERIPIPALPKLPSAQRTAIPAIVEGRMPVPKEAILSPQQEQARASGLKLREQVQAELDKIVQAKLQQAGFTPLMFQAARRLSVGR
jgi:hypothetical protein